MLECVSHARIVSLRAARPSRHDMSLSRRGASVAFLAMVFALCVDNLPLERLVAAEHSFFSGDTTSFDAISPEDPVDVAIVLGYSLKDSVPTLPLEARVHLGVRLFCSGRAKNILFSGAEGKDAGAFVTEAYAMASFARTLLAMNHSLDSRRGGLCAPPSEEYPRRIALHAADHTPVRDRRGQPLRVRVLSGGGVFEEESQPFDWVLEESSTSTRENAVFSLEECRRRGWRRVAVVTNRFHQGRAQRTFRTAAREAAVRNSESKENEIEIFTARMPPELELTTQFPPPGWGFTVRGKELWRAQWNVVRESAAIALYLARGWIHVESRRIRRVF